MLHSVVEACVIASELVAVAVIAFGVLLATWRFGRSRAGLDRSVRFVDIRLGLGRYLALGLEFQLAADLMSTALTPTFADLGKVAALAGIRTALNFFLARENREAQREVQGSTATEVS